MIWINVKIKINFFINFYLDTYIQLLFSSPDFSEVLLNWIDARDA